MVIGTVKNAAKEALRWQNTAGRDPKAPLDWIMAACARFAEASGFFAGLGCFPRAAATPSGWWEFHLCGVQAGRQAAGGMAKGSYEAFRQQALRADPAPFLKNLRPRRAQAMLPAKLAATAFSGAQAAEPLRPTPRFLGGPWAARRWAAPPICCSGTWILPARSMRAACANRRGRLQTPAL